jgi:hypothetical protein
MRFKQQTGRMVSSGMLRGEALVRTDVSEELNASFIRVTRIGELGTTLAVTSNRRTLRGNTKSRLGIGELGTTFTVNSNRSIVFLGSGLRLLVIPDVVPNSLILVTLMMEVIRSPKSSVLTSSTRPNILEDDILQSPP